MNIKESKFSVVWPDYQRKINNGYTLFQQHEEFVDMTLAADGYYVKVHQFIVALASPYLKDIIKSIPVKHPVIFLNNVSYSELCLILEYIYTGEVNIPRQQLKDFMKSAKALKLQGISNAAAVPEMKVPLDNPAISEEPLIDTARDATEETMAISSELERRMSIVQDTTESIPDIDEIIKVGLVNCASSSSKTHTDTNIDSINAHFINTKTQQQVKHEKVETDIGDGIKIVKYVKIVDEDSIMHQTNESESNFGNFEDRNSDQNQESMIPTKAIRSGSINQIGEKTITFSNKTRKRKAGPKSAAIRRMNAQNSTATSDPAVPSIVIQSNIDGHSITIKNPSQEGSTQDIETMPSPPAQSGGKSMLLQSRESTQSTRARRSEKSMPKLTMSPVLLEDVGAKSKTNPMPQLIFTGADTKEHTPTQQQVPQIMLQLPADAPPMDAEDPVEPSTSTQTNELVDLINSDNQERTVLLDRLKVSLEHLYTISNQGSVQMILNRYMYYPHYNAYRGRKRRWRCIDYRRKQCPAYLDTDGEIIVKRVHSHCHIFHDEKILLKLENKLVFGTITSATAGAREKSLGGATESSENIE